MHTWGCIRPHTRVCVCVFVWLFVCLFVYICIPSVDLCASLSLCLSAFASISLSLSSVCLCLCLCLCALCACRKPASTEVSTGSSNIWPNAFVQNPNQLAILLPSLYPNQLLAIAHGFQTLPPSSTSPIPLPYGALRLQSYQPFPLKVALNHQTLYEILNFGQPLFHREEVRAPVLQIMQCNNSERSIGTGSLGGICPARLISTICVF